MYHAGPINRESDVFHHSLSRTEVYQGEVGGGAVATNERPNYAVDV